LLTFHRVLKYVKGAIGETDVPDTLPEFISQRRRWLNGSFFAATYAIAHVGQIMRSGHSMGRKITLMVETVYNTINLVFSWFSIVSNFLCFLLRVGVEFEQGNFYLFFVSRVDSKISLILTSFVGRRDVLVRRSQFQDERCQVLQHPSTGMTFIAGCLFTL
jgi:chitin synthase